MHEPVFVLSTGRCGTLALQRFLLHAPDVEPFHRYRGRSARFRNRMDILLEQNYAHFEVLLNPTCPPARRRRMVERLRRSRMRLVEQLRRENRTFVELNHEFTAFGRLLRDAYPAARFVHLVRNPLDVVRSFVQKLDPVPMSLKAYFGTRYSLKGQYALRYGHAERVGQYLPRPVAEAIRRHRYDLHLHPFERRGDRWVEPSWPLAEKVAWYWNEMNRTAEAVTSDLPKERKLFVRFEDLVQRTTGTLESVLDFLRLRPESTPPPDLFFAAAVNAKTQHREFSHLEGAADIQMTLDRHCGSLMRRFGYSLESC